MSSNKSNQNDYAKKQFYVFSRIQKVLISIVVFQVLFLLILIAVADYKALDINYVKALIEGSFISTGLAIIACAISVWAGLNIANSIDKKTIEEINRKIQDQEKMALDTGRKIKFGRISAKNLEMELSNWERTTLDMEKSIFLREILNTESDVLSRYFYREFSAKDFATSNELAILMRIEQIFSKVYFLHSSSYFADQVLISQAEQGLLLLNNINSNDSLIQLFLKWKKADFLFYKGYCLKQENKKNSFLEAIQIYKKLCDEFHVRLPAYKPDNYTEFKHAFTSIEGIDIYIINSIGESYSKLAHSVYVDGVTSAELIDYAKQAIFYCGIVVSLCENSPEYVNEVYYRNLGCAYERLAVLYGTNGRQFASEIISCYQKAYQWMLCPNNSQKMIPKRMEYIYHTLLSYYERHIRSLLQMSDGPINDNVISSSIEIIRNSRNLPDLLLDFYFISHKAILHFPHYGKYESLHGFAISWILLCTELGVQFDKWSFSSEELFKELKTYCCNLQVMKIEDDYSKNLYTRYLFFKDKLEL